MIELIPTRTSAATGEIVEVELRTAQSVAGQLRVEQLTDTVLTRAIDLPAGRHVVSLGPLARGGYAVALETATGSAETAVDVLDDPFERPRYGFLADFSPDRDDTADTVDDLRRLHLNVVQFYDWMYRHDELVGSREQFTDPLGRSLSHKTTRILIDALHAVGSVTMGYAAVYAASFAYADRWPDQVLRHAEGSRWTLGDLVALTDPTPGRPWVDHFLDQLRIAVAQLGFRGFHLDQYGWPKLALRADGTTVDLAVAFPQLISAIRDARPAERLIFNNVNDFPTETTVASPQDATYIEVWPPNETYADLARLISDARRAAPQRPVILAAYLEPFRNEPVDRAEPAAQLLLATILAHGGHSLLCGERHGVLVHPYYADFARLGDDSFTLLRRHLDAAVALGDLLYDDGPPVTRAWFGGINEELQIAAPVAVSGDPEPGALWAILRRGSDRLTLHLLDLSQQTELHWNRGKQPLTPCTDVSIRLSLPFEPAAVGFAAPAASSRATSLPWTRDGDAIRIEVPSFTGWSVTSILLE
jgi:dextranase